MILYMVAVVVISDCSNRYEHYWQHKTMML